MWDVSGVFDGGCEPQRMQSCRASADGSPASAASFSPRGDMIALSVGSKIVVVSK